MQGTFKNHSASGLTSFGTSLIATIIAQIKYFWEIPGYITVGTDVGKLPAQ